MQKLLQRFKLDIDTLRIDETLSDFQKRQKKQLQSLALLESVANQPCFYYASASMDMQFIHAVAHKKLPAAGWFIHTDYRYLGRKTFPGPVLEWNAALLKGERVIVGSNRRSTVHVELLSLTPFMLLAEDERKDAQDDFLRYFIQEREYTITNNPDCWVGLVECFGRQYPIIFSQIENSMMLKMLLKLNVDVNIVCSYISGENEGGNRLPFTYGKGQAIISKFLMQTGALWVDDDNNGRVRLRKITKYGLKELVHNDNE